MKEYKTSDNGPMLNAYPDSIGGRLKDIASFLKRPELKDTFKSLYVLPSIFNSDIDRGFSIIDYDLNEQLADKDDLDDIASCGMNLKLDFVLNHASVLSKEFQDIIRNGEKSEYKDYFINWNSFWDGYGKMTDEGYIMPDDKYLQKMFFRKPGLPILMVRFPDGSMVPYWNTFYQEIKYEDVNEQDLITDAKMQYSSALKLKDIINESLHNGRTPAEIDFGEFESYRKDVLSLIESKRRYLGQMDLNVKSPLVWQHYRDTLEKLSGYGARIVRLDAFAYASKEPGQANFLNEPGTWELLSRIQSLADEYNVKLLPEIHESYSKGTYKVLADKGYMTYDFFLPGLIIDALESGSFKHLKDWAYELQDNKIRVVNMLGCHDGIPLLDLKGMIPDERIDELIKLLISRGGFVKNLHGKKNMYYQVNMTYYSALGEDDRKMILARAIQMFMPGKPQIWYLDLFAGRNDYEAVKRAGAGGHKEINRTNISVEQIDDLLKEDVVRKQLQLIKFRNTCPAFAEGTKLAISTNNKVTNFEWKNGSYSALLIIDYEKSQFEVCGQKDGNEIFKMNI